MRTYFIGFGLAAFLMPLAASADITTGLVGHWLLEEGSGTTANDSSGEGNHGDLVGDPLPDWVAGYEGTGLEFFWNPGIANNGVEVSPSPISFERDEPFSMALWLKRLESEDGYLLANQGLSFEGMALLLSASDSAEMPTDDSLTFRLRDTDSGIDVSLASGVLAGSDWHHVVVTYDGSSDADGVLFYIDGEPSAVASVNEDDLDGSSDAGEPFYFGLSDVVVDDVRLYDRVLSSGDVTELYGAEEEEEAPPRTIILDATIIQLISGKIVILANGEGGGAGPVYEEEEEPEPEGYSFTLTSGFGGGGGFFYQGYDNVSVGSIDAEPIPGETLVSFYYLFSSDLTGISFSGDITSLLSGKTVWVDGVEQTTGWNGWSYDGSTYTTGDWDVGDGPTLSAAGVFFVEIK